MAMRLVLRPIDPKKWYIVDTFKKNHQGRPRLIKKKFDNRFQIKMQLEKHFPGNLRFEAIKGQDAIDLGLTIRNASPNLYVHLQKYGYENYMITVQDRKSHRTRFRRHQRRKRGELYKRKY